MSQRVICGEIKKKSQLGISWNSRYLAIVDNHINIYKTEQEYKKQNHKCKYSFNIANAKITKKNEQKNIVKIEILLIDKKKYEFQIPQHLWVLLDAYHSNKNNPPNQQIDANEEQKTQDTKSTDQNPTESHEILIKIKDTNTEKAQESQQEEEQQVQQKAIVNETAIDINIDIEESNKKEEKEEQNETKPAETKEYKDSQEPKKVEPKKVEPKKVEPKYNWNKKYKNILDMRYNKQEEKEKEMKELVSEFCLMCKKKCIHLIENEILVNDNLDEIEDTFMREEIEFKIIKTEHEFYEKKLLITNLKQYANVFDEESEKLYCPLSCIVEYLNCKIYCRASLITMNVDNLIFGKDFTDNAFKYDDKISKLLNKVALKLNLCKHVCKYDTNIQISTTSNIRIHEIENGVYYIDNISELYPVDTVHFIKNSKNNEISVLSKTARLPPKFVELNYDSISSDAFIPPNDDANDSIASIAIYNLHSNIIPKFAENINNSKIKILDCYQLEQLMFERGINIIYTGEIYNLCKILYAKQIIGIFMIAQITKKQINNESFTSRKNFAAKMKHCISSFINNDDSYKIESNMRDEIISLTNNKYGVLLTANEINQFPPNLVEHEFQRVLNINKQKGKYTFNTKMFLSIPDKYIENTLDIQSIHHNDMQLIQTDWLNLQDCKSNITNRNKFETFKKSCTLLMNRIDKIFPFHIIKFDIMNVMIHGYMKIADNSAEMVDYGCSLYSDCFDLSTLLFGSKHRQTLLIQVQLAKLLHSNGKYTESVDKLKDLLTLIRSTFGKATINSVIILKMLSDTYFDQGNYDKSIEFAKETILILDERKKFNHEEYFNAHLKISLIAEKIDDHALGMRFLNKMYNYLKKQMEKENKQKLWENIDIKILCFLISRTKLKMCNNRKLNDLMKKWKQFHEDKYKNNDYSIDEYNKYKELIIQNLCLNPIKKSNDLLKRNTETNQVVCWINIIKEFEAEFLGVRIK